MARKASGGKMRNIKFRVWNNNEDVFHYLQFTNTGIKTEDDPMTRGCVVYQQYTGLKDRNGKEIYEGDLIISDHWDSQEHLVVKWDEDACKFYASLPSGGDRIDMDENSKLVVGNIFEG